jgi:hypothetical protein
MQINNLITELLTTFIPQNTTSDRKHTDLKLIDIACCPACKHVFLVVENAILIRYY